MNRRQRINRKFLYKTKTELRCNFDIFFIIRFIYLFCYFGRFVRKLWPWTERKRKKQQKKKIHLNFIFFFQFFFYIYFILWLTISSSFSFFYIYGSWPMLRLDQFELVRVEKIYFSLNGRGVLDKAKETEQKVTNHRYFHVACYSFIWCYFSYCCEGGRKCVLISYAQRN